MVKVKGISLVELMVVIALIAILALSIFPLGRSWISNSKITQTQKIILEAYSKTRNEALRNPNHVKGNTKAAVLQLESGEIVVNDSAGQLIWKSKIPTNVEVEFIDCSDVTNQVVLNNNAHRLTASCEGYTIQSAGGQDESGSF